MNTNINKKINTDGMSHEELQEFSSRLSILTAAEARKIKESGNVSGRQLNKVLKEIEKEVARDNGQYFIYVREILQAGVINYLINDLGYTVNNLPTKDKADPNHKISW